MQFDNFCKVQWPDLGRILTKGHFGITAWANADTYLDEWISIYMAFCDI